MGLMQGKVALISGGAEGIGGATARRIVDEGGSVVLGDIQHRQGQGAGRRAWRRARSPVSLDVRDLAQWEAAVQTALDRFGKLTHLANIAGISEPGAVPDVDLDSWQRTHRHQPEWHLLRLPRGDPGDRRIGRAGRDRQHRIDAGAARRRRDLPPIARPRRR